jgi:hypothetical protein
MPDPPAASSSRQPKKAVHFNEMTEVYFQDETETTVPEAAYEDDTEMDFSELLNFSQSNDSYDDDWHEYRDLSNSDYEDYMEETSASEEEESSSDDSPHWKGGIKEMEAAAAANAAAATAKAAHQRCDKSVDHTVETTCTGDTDEFYDALHSEPDEHENKQSDKPQQAQHQNCDRDDDSATTQVPNADAAAPANAGAAMGWFGLLTMFGASFGVLVRCIRQQEEVDNREDDLAAFATLSKGVISGGGNHGAMVIPYVLLCCVIVFLLVY